MSQEEIDAILSKLDQLSTNDGSKVNQIVMLCLQAFTILFVMMKPLCTMYIKAKYKVKSTGSPRTSNEGPSNDF